MGSDKFKSTILNTNDTNKISSCLDKDFLKSSIALNNEPKMYKGNSHVGFNGKKAFLLETFS
jgi:hypothetical protein